MEESLRMNLSQERHGQAFLFASVNSTKWSLMTIFIELIRYLRYRRRATSNTLYSVQLPEYGTL